MNKYTVEKGSHDFKPNDQPFITWSNKVDWSFQFTPSMYYRRSDPDYPYGDYNGWNKLGLGVTWFFSGNANRSAMVGYFPDEINLNRFNVVGYTNDEKGNWSAEPLANVGLESYEGQTIWASDFAVFKIRKKGSDADYKFLQMPLKRPPFGLKLYRGIGGFFGGQFPAFKDMRYYAATWY